MERAQQRRLTRSIDDNDNLVANAVSPEVSRGIVFKTTEPGGLSARNNAGRTPYYYRFPEEYTDATRN
jgi:hypothetical protein